MACFLAEWYRTELTERAVGGLTALLESTAQVMSVEAAPVRLLVTVSVPADDALYGIFEADAPEVVLRTCTRAGALPHRLTPQVQTWIAPASKTA
ncbi:hypothetical protein CIW49_14565 [Mycolicibacterium sp. P1-18]|uniref:hypothetical protein n=1 Tax=Mycolicibacterium sp. P1-18 TaxID=2024615 RepID=UPI0011F2F84E|nr:hypothetical protein [Mycolicibacterium sp. P1-18]KAA0097911.1 hypothetical protein CIW49_14565 [Mycolicibacterium sp. P1-18]